MFMMSRDVATTKQKFYSLLCGDGEEESGNYVPTWERKGSDLLINTQWGRSRTVGVVEQLHFARISSIIYGKALLLRTRNHWLPGQVGQEHRQQLGKIKREERTECLSEAINRLCMPNTRTRTSSFSDDQ